MADQVLVALVLVVLAVAGYAYDRFIVTPIEAYHQHPFTAGLVIAGVLFTLAGAAAVIGLTDALLALACFAASGAFVTVGAARRWLTRAEADRVAMQKEVLRQIEADQ